MCLDHRMRTILLSVMHAVFPFAVDAFCTVCHSNACLQTSVRDNLRCLLNAAGMECFGWQLEVTSDKAFAKAVESWQVVLEPLTWRLHKVLGHHWHGVAVEGDAVAEPLLAHNIGRGWRSLQSGHLPGSEMLRRIPEHRPVCIGIAIAISPMHHLGQIEATVAGGICGVRRVVGVLIHLRRRSWALHRFRVLVTVGQVLDFSSGEALIIWVDSATVWAKHLLRTIGSEAKSTYWIKNGIGARDDPGVGSEPLLLQTFLEVENTPEERHQHLSAGEVYPNIIRPLVG